MRLFAIALAGLVSMGTFVTLPMAEAGGRKIVVEGHTYIYRPYFGGRSFHRPRYFEAPAPYYRPWRSSPRVERVPPGAIIYRAPRVIHREPRVHRVQPTHRPRRRHGYFRDVDAHVNWCSRRYRSYRVKSDTFQPHHGARRRCLSPYR